PPRREPPGAGPHHRQGRDHLDESRFRARQGFAAGECRADAFLAVRRLQLRYRAQGQTGVLGAVPSRSLARPARQPLSLHTLRRRDAAGQRWRQAQDRVSLGMNGDTSAPLTFIFADDDSIPNNPLPMLYYRRGIDLSGSIEPEEIVERAFAANGWGRDMWRNGIFPYVHYHS